MSRHCRTRRQRRAGRRGIGTPQRFRQWPNLGPPTTGRAPGRGHRYGPAATSSCARCSWLAPLTRVTWPDTVRWEVPGSALPGVWIKANKFDSNASVAVCQAQSVARAAPVPSQRRRSLDQGKPLHGCDQTFSSCWSYRNGPGPSSPTISIARMTPFSSNSYPNLWVIAASTRSVFALLVFPVLPALLNANAPFCCAPLSTVGLEPCLCLTVRPGPRKEARA